MKILKISLINDNDFHTMGQIKGSTLDFLMDASGHPFIPGTHIKGVMRTEAERIIRSIQNIDCRITGDWDQKTDSKKGEKKDFTTCSEVKNGNYGCDVCSIFGAPNKEGDNYNEGKIRVLNFSVNCGITPAQRMHVSIDRDSLSKKDKALFSTRTVPSGCKFTGHIILKNLSATEERLFYASLHSMVHYGLGGERSRGLGSFCIKRMEEISLDEFLEEGVKLD